MGVLLPLGCALAGPADDGDGGGEALVEDVAHRPWAAVAGIDELEDAHGCGEGQGGEPEQVFDLLDLALLEPEAIRLEGAEDLLDAPAGVAARIIAIAQAKTTGYEALGYAGMITVFVKAILCNWMVCLAIVAAMTTTSTIGKIACAYMPIFLFFEHSVVNMFIIPTGMMMGAKVTVAEWWVWNQIPVTLGNLVGGAVFTGLALYITHKPRTSAPAPLAAPTQVPAE